jgi:Tfp pilus assembly pilus retraction ATPase PilT
MNATTPVPAPILNEGQNLLAAMKKCNATDLRILTGAVPAFKTPTGWRKEGAELTEAVVRQSLTGLLTPGEFQNVLSGIDLKKVYALSGVGDFRLSVYLRDGKPAWTAANA